MHVVEEAGHLEDPVVKAPRFLEVSLFERDPLEARKQEDVFLLAWDLLPRSKRSAICELMTRRHR